MDSMEEIYMKHGKMIYGFLLTRTRDPGLAEELTQETFYQAVKMCIRDSNVMMRFSEMILSFPSLILAMIINAVMGSNLFNTMFALIVDVYKRQII